ncbi:MAG TPA: helix-turn-helix domain-containing protein [Candidatus Mediterraneibacter merdigallinarum]|nr:helix-turn-helix domain-containing protein [Candidatus Mediterraneibacter merdigallinarum]
MTFGEKIQKLRKEAGLSQEELACQLGVSRQAVSKWERDSGYPETEKIIHMSRLFNVTLDYLLNEENSRRDQDSAPSRAEEEKGFYVSLETARGFLACQKVRYRKISLAVFLFIASLAFCFMQAETGILIFMILIIAGAVLLFSVKLNDYPYRRLWSEPLLFDKNILSELTVEYTNYRKRAHAGILTGIALIGIGILFLPLLLPAEQELWDSVVLGAGMVLAGAGSFLCIYQTGMVKSYRLLIRNTNQF